jgi:hypothetical protein
MQKKQVFWLSSSMIVIVDHNETNAENDFTKLRIVLSIEINGQEQMT